MVHETGLCVWRSGQRPQLELKTPGEWLAGRMALLWTGSSHTTYEVGDETACIDCMPVFSLDLSVPVPALCLWNAGAGPPGRCWEPFLVFEQEGRHSSSGSSGDQSSAAIAEHGSSLTCQLICAGLS